MSPPAQVARLGNIGTILTRDSMPQVVDTALLASIPVPQGLWHANRAPLENLPMLQPPRHVAGALLVAFKHVRRASFALLVALAGSLGSLALHYAIFALEESTPRPWTRLCAKIAQLVCFHLNLEAQSVFGADRAILRTPQVLLVVQFAPEDIIALLKRLIAIFVRVVYLVPKEWVLSRSRASPVGFC
jgi:hypothetical protein